MTTTEIQEAQLTLLLVDDDDFSLNLAHLTLSRLGFAHVRIARDGREGLRALDAMQPPPDFLICDIFMPNQDGIELMGELAKRGYRGGVVLVSGGDGQMLSIAHQIAVESGLNVLGVISKPLQQDALQQVLFGRLASPIKQ